MSGHPAGGAPHRNASSATSKLEDALTTTFEYVLDARGNWTQQLEYISAGGPRQLKSTETRTITYAAP